MKLKEWHLKACHILDKKFKSSPYRFFIAVGCFLLIAYILFSKFFSSSVPEPPIVKIPKVEVMESQTQKFKPLLKLSAETKAARIITVRAEVAGKVVEILEEKGQNLQAKQPVLKIIDNDQVARLAHAQAAMTHRTAEYAAALKLKSKNFIAENSFLEAKANLEAAKASLVKAQYECEQLIVKAPFDGYYESRFVEEGDYVGVGDKLITFVDLSVLKLNTHISEKDILSIKLNQSATVIINSSAITEAKVTYISKVADSKTRTFLVELVMDNSKLNLPEGLTAKVELAREEEQVHIISPSVLTLDDQGIIGIMVIEEQNKATFKPVEILQANAEKIYVKGLPSIITLISVGSEFVKTGQIVEPVFAKAQTVPS
jgi:multidrug efflux system membrane fusion protein